MPNLYANPYNIDAKGFYFKDFDEYEKKAEKSGVEEFEIEFIDGDDVELMVFKAMDVNQSNIEEYFDVADDIDEEDAIKIAILTQDMQYSFQDALDRADDLIVYGEFRSDKDFAMEYVDQFGSLGDALGDNVGNYFDFDSFGRDIKDDDDDGIYDEMSDQEAGEDYVDSIGGVKELDKQTQENYFDWDAFARDLMMGMSVYDGVYYNPNSI